MVKGECMEFIVGYSWDAFNEYYQTLDDLQSYYKSLGLNGFTNMAVGETEARIIKADPSHLIVWCEGQDVVGHAIWHETSTDEHHIGEPRDEDDRVNLRRLFDGKMENLVEVHEVWLRPEHRGMGFGKQFFTFFEEFIRERGFVGIVYYTENPAGIAICRQRGYREAELESKGWKIFALVVNQ